jgi:hypothetical protein
VIFAATQALLAGSELPASSTPTLAVEWRGENGVERLENRLGKPLRGHDPRGGPQRHLHRD